MIGGVASRHMNSRRRSSSPNVSPRHQLMLQQHLARMHAKAAKESSKEGHGGGNVDDDEGAPSPKVSSNLLRVPLPPDAPPAVQLSRRRRAVDTSDHKTCAILQTKLKTMKFPDVA